MMKTEYIIPLVRIVKIQPRTTILAGSAIPQSEDGDADAKSTSFFIEESEEDNLTW